jgi:hypothetical protein
MTLKRKLTIGLLSSLFIIVYYIFSIFINSTETRTNQVNQLYQIINLIIFNVFNISIWIILRDLILFHYKQSHLTFFYYYSLIKKENRLGQPKRCGGPDKMRAVG